MLLQGSRNRRQINRRISLLQYFMVVSMVLIGAGYWRVQISSYRQYAQLAEDNRIRDLPIIAPRGRLLDREGRVLGGNTPTFRVMLHGASNPLSDLEIERISQVLDVDAGELQELSRKGVSSNMVRPQVLKQSATLDDIAFIESHHWEYPELDLIHFPRRSYPRGNLAAHLLGYVGEVSEEMLAKPNTRFRRGGVMGRSGVESSYDEYLAGKDGVRRAIVDSRGREFDSEDLVLAESGNDLRLTLDLDLQRTAENTLGDREGAVVALDPRTGEVLAMVSRPTFDPDVFAGRISSKDWQGLVNHPGKPLLNRAIQAHLAPGSTFKIVIAAAALETAIVDPSAPILCRGSATIYGHTFNDWIPRGHGWVNLHRAIVRSCDVYFYRLGAKLGIERIAFFSKRLGLGSPTGIDLPGEVSGLIPSPEWVRQRFQRRWFPGETISVAIGQGAVAVTPLQLAHAIGGIASGGVFRQPYIVFRDQLEEGGREAPPLTEKRFPLSEATVEILCRGMWGVVNEDGTGVRARIRGLDIGGKTGTAQVVSRRTREEAGEDQFKANAWFVGTYPSRNPEIVVSVLIVGGEHSYEAIPVAREIIRTYLEKKPPQEDPPEGFLVKVAGKQEDAVRETELRNELP